MIDSPEVIPDQIKKQQEKAARQMQEHKDRREGAAGASSPAAPAPLAETPAAAPPAAVAASGAEPTHPTEKPAADPGVQNVETPEQKLERIEAEKADLRRQLDSANGRFGGQVQNLKSKIFDLEEQLKSQVPAAAPAGSSPATVAEVTPTAAAAPASAPPQGTPAHLKHVTEEMIERYGDDFFTMVAAVARGIDEEKDGELEKKISTQTKNHLAVQESRQLAREYWTDVDAIEPGASVINGNPDEGIACEPNWSTFLDEPVRPGSSLTRRQEAEAAVVNRNPIAFAALVKEYRARGSESTRSEQPPRPSVASQAVPASVQGDGALPPEKGAKRQIPESEITKYRADAAKGQFTIEEANERMKEYDAAYREKRVLVGA